RAQIRRIDRDALVSEGSREVLPVRLGHLGRDVPAEGLVGADDGTRGLFDRLSGYEPPGRRSIRRVERDAGDAQRGLRPPTVVEEHDAATVVEHRREHGGEGERSRAGVALVEIDERDEANRATRHATRSFDRAEDGVTGGMTR